MDETLSAQTLPASLPFHSLPSLSVELKKTPSASRLLIQSPMDSVVQLDEPWLPAAFARNLLSGTALLLWETLLTFGSEVEFLWSKSNRSLIKWLYLWIRYYGLAGQILFTVMIFRLPLSLESCRIWYAMQFVLGQLLLSAVELVLMFRVYALYNRDRRVALVMGIFLLSEIAALCGTFLQNIAQLNFTPRCHTVLDPALIVYYSIATVSNHTVIIGLTLGKQFLGSRVSWGRTPLVQVVMRDGTLAFLFMFGLLCMTMMHFIVQGNAMFVFPVWCFPLASLVGCRLILNMHQFTVVRAPTRFTTNIIIDTNENMSRSMVTSTSQCSQSQANIFQMDKL